MRGSLREVPHTMHASQWLLLVVVAIKLIKSIFNPQRQRSESPNIHEVVIFIFCLVFPKLFPQIVIKACMHQMEKTKKN
jgi:hypothetical protein